MLGNIDIDRLKRSKNIFEGFKLSKLSIVAKKHIKDDYDFGDLIEHLESEWRELKGAYSIRSRKKFLEELADLSNVLDLIFDYMENMI